MKITQEQQKQGQELLKNLIEKAWESTVFKEQLINNPTKAISEVMGKDVNITNQKIVVEDQTDPSVIYLNIPVEPKFDELELTDEQLEVVAGGATPLVLTIPLADAIAAFALGAGIYAAVK